MAKKKEVSQIAAEQLRKTFNLENFKDKKLLNNNVRFKEQSWIPLSEAFQEVTSVPGIPMGHISILRGYSDTGKTTALLECAVNAQKKGILPVFIITEMKWNWEHAKMMGFEFNEDVDTETGEVINYSGNFIYVDRETLHTIEDVAGFIGDLLNEQKLGNLPYDLLFLWDSIGSVPCELSVRSNKNNNEWNAGALSTQFGNNINQRIVMSRKVSSSYTNSLVCVNKVWTAKAANPMSQPKLMNKGGFTMGFDATFVITFGNVSDSGTNKIKAIKGGKTIEFAKRTNIQIEKNHVSGIQTRGKIIMTPQGFIPDTDKSLNLYKKQHSHEWASVLGQISSDEEYDTIEETEDTTTIYNEE